MTFLDELRRRNVHRVGAAYLVAAWLLVQVAATILPACGLGATTVRIVVVVLTIGLLPALVFAWVFEITLARSQFAELPGTTRLATFRGAC